MKNKIIKSVLVICILIVNIVILCACEMLANGGDEKIEDVYIELLSSDEKSVEKIIVEKRDSSKIGDIIMEEEIIPDGGFVFAPSGYRIVINTGEEEINYYPYCGDVSTIRVGEEGYDFIWLEDEEAEKLKTILDKYNSGREGIWDWSKVNYND